MKISAYALLVYLTCTIAVSGQMPDQWKGLVLDEATPEKAIAVLGTPKSEKKTDRFMAYRNKGLKDAKDLKILQWKDIQGFDEVTLYFVDGTLGIILLEKPKEKLPAKVFVDAYEGVTFDIGRAPQTSAFYELEATTPRSKIYAGVGNAFGSVGRTLLGSLATEGRVDKLLGNVVHVIIQSRRMDDKRGVDALK